MGKNLHCRPARHSELTDELWARIRPLLPERRNTHPYGGGRPRVPDRRCMEGILFVLRTGSPWRSLDRTGIVSGSTAHDRFQEWVADGVFYRIWQQGLLTYDELQGIDWSWLSADGAQTKAPLGGEKNGAQPDGSRQVRDQT